MTRWEDVIARARGLGTHLLTRDQVTALAHSPDLPSLAERLRRHGYGIDPSDRTPDAIEQAARRLAAARLRLLARWCADRRGMLAVVFEEEDRRSLRALVRGAAGGVSEELRLSGLIPTPALPDRALAELARQPSIRAIAALLSAWRNDYAAVLQPLAGAAEPDLLRIEIELGRAFARRATDAARGAGARGAIERYARELIDSENCVTALALAEDNRDFRPSDAFIGGGRHITARVFEMAILAKSGATTILARAAGGALSRALRAAAGDPALLDAALVHERIAALAAEQRVNPLSPVGILGYALRLRAEVMDVSRIAWGIALGTPPETMLTGLAA